MPDQPSVRERILEAARLLVLERGFAATTVDAVLAGAEASKGAFFHHFPSKAQLGRALVEQYAAGDRELLETFMAAAEAGTDDPAEQLVEFVRRLEHAADAASAVQPVCLFISFIYEAELTDAETSQVVTDSILHWRRRILDKLEAAARDREWLASADLPAVADHVFVTIEGAFLLGRALGDLSSLRAQIALLRDYLELLLDVRPASRTLDTASAS